MQRTAVVGLQQELCAETPGAPLHGCRHRSQGLNPVVSQVQDTGPCFLEEAHGTVPLGRFCTQQCQATEWRQGRLLAFAERRCPEVPVTSAHQYFQ